MCLHFGYQQINTSSLIYLEILKYTVSAKSGKFLTGEDCLTFHENNLASTLVLMFSFTSSMKKLNLYE